MICNVPVIRSARAAVKSTARSFRHFPSAVMSPLCYFLLSVKLRSLAPRMMKSFGAEILDSASRVSRKCALNRPIVRSLFVKSAAAGKDLQPKRFEQSHTQDVLLFVRNGDVVKEKSFWFETKPTVEIYIAHIEVARVDINLV